MSEPKIETDYAKRISQLEQRIADLEQKLTLVGDVTRYQRLQELLVAQEFKAADIETSRLILEITGHKDKDLIVPDDMSKFPCNALKVIDRLWVNHSQGRFGYSVQLEIYCSVGGSAETLQTQDLTTFRRYGDLVGWRVNGEWQGENYDQWNFSLEAPKGCFPADSWKSAYGLKMVTYFFTRLLNCDLLASS